MDPRASLMMAAADKAQAAEFGHLIPRGASEGRDHHMHAVTLERDYNPALQEDFEARIEEGLAALDGRPPARKRTAPLYRPGAPVWTDLHLAIARRMTREAVRSLTDERALPGFQLPDDEGDYYYLQSDVSDWVKGAGPPSAVQEHDEQFRTYVIDMALCNKAAHQDRPCVYVGQSWYGPTERFLRHLVGKDGSGHVWKWGTRLLPEHYEHLRPTDERDESKEQEQLLAEQLVDLGYSVHGGT